MYPCDLDFASFGNEGLLSSAISSLATPCNIPSSTIEPLLGISHSPAQCDAAAWRPSDVKSGHIYNHISLPTLICNHRNSVSTLVGRDVKFETNTSLIEGRDGFGTAAQGKVSCEFEISEAVKDFHQSSLTWTTAHTSDGDLQRPKKKRDWMSSFGKSREKNVQSAPTCIITSSADVLNDERPCGSPIRKSTNHQGIAETRVCDYKFPAGWETYLDLETFETYYVNWSARTKHYRIDCPEVQRCLRAARQPYQQLDGDSLMSCPLHNADDAKGYVGSRNNNNKISSNAAEAWL